MLIFLHGPDTYRLRQKMQELLSDYKNNFPEGASFRYFDFSKEEPINEGTSASFEDFKKESNNISLFGERKVFCLNNVFLSSEFKKKFLQEAEIFSKTKDIILICQEGNVDSDDDFYKFLRKNAKVQKFKALKGPHLKKWLKREFEKHKTPITDEALEKLIIFVGEDLWRLSNEVRKLVSFKNQQEIILEDIKMHVQPQIETDIFKTIEAIAQRNKKQALQLLHHHLEKGDSPLYLFSMINFQFRNLLLVRDLMERQKSFAEILRQLPFHPLVIKKSYFQAKHFSFQELKKIYQKIFQLDFQIKIGKVKPEIALDLFITQI